jgi:dCMP deaminase
MDLSNDKIKKYMDLTNSIANIFSKDPSTKVGALFISNTSHRVLTMGYNGMPRGFDETIDERWKRPEKYMYVEHAERNAIYNACRNGVQLEDSTAFVTLFPCTDCIRAMIQSGVKMIVSLEITDDVSEQWRENFKYSMEIAKECGIVVKFIK